jgi:hypothetical protein
MRDIRHDVPGAGPSSAPPAGPHPRFGPPVSSVPVSTPPHGPEAGILSGPMDLDASRRAPAFRAVDARRGLRATHVASGVIGKVAGCTATTVRLRDTAGRVHVFSRAAGAFTVEGERVALVPPVGRSKQRAADASSTAPRTASGSISARRSRARVARPSRLWVEGVHDAELVEKVWGDDLRVEGVVVERLDGADDLAARVREFDPAPDRRLGVLLDHLVDGSKEQRLAAEVRDRHVMVRGHRFVDIWQAVKPATVGLEAWPEVPLGAPWKEGVCAAVGWAGTTREFWVRLLGSVDSYRDLEPSLLAAVEELIDFVAPPPTDG